MAANLDPSGEKGVTLAQILAMATRAERPEAERIRSSVPALYKPKHDEPHTSYPRSRISPPSQYKVVLIDEGFAASAKFIFNELQTRFHKSRAEAGKLTREVLNTGSVIAGVYPFEVADHKARLVIQDAHKAGSSLELQLEKA